MKRQYFLAGGPLVLAVLALLAVAGFGRAAPSEPAAPAQLAAVAANQPPAVNSPASTAAPVEPSATPEPSAPALASRGGARPQRIGIQVGHWLTEDLPDELASLRTSTGAAGAGWREVDVNLDIGQRVAALLEAAGFKVDLLPSTVPAGYQADVFLALHCDSGSSSTANGFKVARSGRSAIPTVDDALVQTIYDVYGRLTGLARDDKNITRNMTYYFAFAGRYTHSVAKTTPAAILEMGFLSNPSDRQFLTDSPDRAAQAIATALSDFLASQ